MRLRRTRVDQQIGLLIQNHFRLEAVPNLLREIKVYTLDDYRRIPSAEYDLVRSSSAAEELNSETSALLANILLHSNVVRGRTVVDVESRSGIVAIAAALAG